MLPRRVVSQEDKSASGITVEVTSPKAQLLSKVRE